MLPLKQKRYIARNILGYIYLLICHNNIQALYNNVHNSKNNCNLSNIYILASSLGDYALFVIQKNSFRLILIIFTIKINFCKEC